MPVDNEKFAEDIRDAVRALMEADPYYLDLGIVTERLKDIDAKLDETVKLTDGIVVVLMVASLGKPVPNLPGANFDEVKLVARCIENLDLNATGKSSMQIAIHTAALWSQMKLDNVAADLKLEGVDLGDDPRGVTYDATATTIAGTSITIPKLGEIVVDSSDLNAIALTHPEPGAGIFYTVNDTRPIPRNPARSVYVAPFEAASGVTLRARAYLAGFLPSDEVRVIL